MNDTKPDANVVAPGDADQGALAYPEQKTIDKESIEWAEFMAFGPAEFHKTFIACPGMSISERQKRVERLANLATTAEPQIQSVLLKMIQNQDKHSQKGWRSVNSKRRRKY
jgi:hypothetical protein